MELRGTTALVTGASGKVGRVLVPALVKEGVRCICHFDKQSQFLDEVKCDRECLVPAQADLAAHGGVEKVFAEVDRLGKAQILIQLAGTFEPAGLEDLTDKSLRRQIEINLVAPMRVAREFARRIPGGSGPNPQGKVIHFTDIAATRPWAGYSAYCAAKAGLTAFTQSLAKELAPRILVNAVAPGMLEGGLEDPTQREKEVRRIPAGRLGTIQEVVEAALFLLKNDYMNGQVLTVDGGRNL